MGITKSLNSLNGICFNTTNTVTPNNTSAAIWVTEIGVWYTQKEVSMVKINPRFANGATKTNLFSLSDEVKKYNPQKLNKQMVTAFA